MPPSKEFYRAFEDRYRGSRELIKSRLQAYARYLQLIEGFFPGCSALDLGCGRGEWLEVLASRGITALGVDLDGGMLAACCELNLNTLKGDALAYLKNTPAEGLALISAFHLVEHIGFDALRDLATDSLRSLKPGGLLILETPNPENPGVGASTFFRDPTHDKPIPPELLSFLCEYTGFARVKILRLQTAPHLLAGAQPTIFDVLTGSSADYAVVAQKAHPDPGFPAITEIPEDASFSFHELCDNYSQKIEDRYEQALWAVSSRLQKIQDQHTREIEIKNNRIQILDREKTECDAHIRELERKIYGVPASKHAYRALMVLLRNPHYRRLTPGRRTKNYHKLNAPWHTHLYRMLLCLCYEGRISWHTHAYRACLSLVGHRRYRPLHNPQFINLEQDMQRILFSPDHADRKLPLPPDAESLLIRFGAKSEVKGD